MSVILPDSLRPTNLHLDDGVKIETLDGDVLGICDQMKEISRDLFVVVLSQEDQDCAVIMEHCKDGVDRLIFRVKKLDGRVIKRLQKLMAKPLNERMDELEALEYRMQEEIEEEQFEKLYDELGRPMWTQLEHDGFIQRPVSYPKRGITAPGKAR